MTGLLGLAGRTDALGARTGAIGLSLLQSSMVFVVRMSTSMMTTTTLYIALRLTYLSRHNKQTVTDIQTHKSKSKGKVQYYMRFLHEMQLVAKSTLTTSEVAADWHELMILQRNMQLSTARINKQLDK